MSRLPNMAMQFVPCSPEQSGWSNFGYDYSPFDSPDGMQMFSNNNSGFSLFAPREFDLSLDFFNASGLNSMSNVSFDRPMPPQQPQTRAKDNLLHVVPSKLESDLQAILQSTELARRNSSSSDDMSPNPSENKHQLRLVKSRRIMGRNASYYQQYGSVCIHIPKQMPPPSSPSQPVSRSSQKWRKQASVQMECSFCKKISPDYQSHWLKNVNKEITCPVLLAYTCPLCGGKAHTMRYCPLKREILAQQFQRYKDQHAFNMPDASANFN